MEAAHLAGVPSVEIDAARYIDLLASEQVNHVSKKRRPVVRSVVAASTTDAVALEEDVAAGSCFISDVFHFVDKRDKSLEAFILAHGGQLAKHDHKGVTRLVRLFQDESDSRVVTADDIRAAAAAGGFLPLVVLPPSEVPADSKKRRDLVGADAPKKKSKKTASPARPAKTRGDDTAAAAAAAVASTSASHAHAATSSSSSALDPAVGEFVAWIGNLDDINEDLRKFELDVDRIGRLSPTQLAKGFGLLSDAVAVLQKKYDRKRLEAISSDFYSAIPHNTGAKRPPLIDSMSLIEAKSALLRNLQHITFASELHGGKASAVVGPDRLYAAMHVELAPIVLLTSPTHTKEFERIERYINTTCDPSHPRVTVESVFAVHRAAEARFVPRARDDDDIGEREMMLFHGTRKTNLMSLFRNGVQVAPAEAPLTGAMFGRAIYASSCASKSAQYCRVDSKAPRGVLLLLAVRVGKSERRHHASAAAPSAAHQSVHGVGVTSNAPAALDECGIEWPGELAASGVTAGLLDEQTSLQFDEYAVYDAKRVRIRYAVVVRIHEASGGGGGDSKAKKGKKASVKKATKE